MPARIELAPGTQDNGLATMLAELVAQNVAGNPDKESAFAKLSGRVAIVAEDAGVALTLHFSGGGLTVHDGITGIPDVTIRAQSDDIMKLSLVELGGPLGLPDPRGENARDVQNAVLSGRIRIHGLFANLPLLVRLTRVMSVS